MSSGCSSFHMHTISSVVLPMLALLLTLPVKAPGTFSAPVMRLSTRTFTLRLPRASMVGRKIATPVCTDRPSLSKPIRYLFGIEFCLFGEQGCLFHSDPQ